MATVDEIKIIVRAETDAAIAKLTQLNKTTIANKDSAYEFAKSVAGLSTAYNLGVQAAQKVISGLAEIGKQAILNASAYEQAKISWGVMLGDMGKGEKMFTTIQNLAAKTPLSFQSVEQGARTLKQFGLATEDVIPTIKMLGDVSGGNEEKLRGLAVVYGQVMSTGRLMGQDLLQLINQGFNPLQVISEKTGESMATLKKRMEGGGVSAKEVSDAFKTATSEGGLFYGMMDTMAETAAGKWSTAVDTWNQTLAKAGEKILPELVRMLGVVTGELDRLTLNTTIKQILSGEIKDYETVTAAYMQLQNELNNARERGYGILIIKKYEDQLKQLGPIQNKARVEEELKAKALKQSEQNTAAYRKEQEQLSNAEKNRAELLDAVYGSGAADTRYYSDATEGAIEHRAAMAALNGELQKNVEVTSDADRIAKELLRSEGDAFSPEVQEQINKINSKLTEGEEELKKYSAAIGIVNQAWGQISNAINAYMDLQDNVADAELARMKAAGASEEELAARKNELQKKAFENQKALSMANAAVSGAEAFVGALATKPTAVGLILAGIVAASTAAQIGMIASQTYVPMAEGGIVKHGNGGILANIGEGKYDEAVIPLKPGAGNVGGITVIQNISGSVWQTRELEALAVGAMATAGSNY